MPLCPCGSQQEYNECCEPVIKGTKSAATAEILMRARYSAYAMKVIDYLRSSLHPDHRSGFDEKNTRQWAERSTWEKLEILGTTAGGPDDTEGTVEFVATFVDNGLRRDHREVASFQKADGHWYLTDGEVQRPRQVVRSEPKTGRNDPCPCGSGKKFKKCCGTA